MQADPGGGLRDAAAAGEQDVEVAVRAEQHQQRGERGERPAQQYAGDTRGARGCAGAVPPAEVQRGGRRRRPRVTGTCRPRTGLASLPGPQQERHPRHTAAGEVGADHAAQRPRLEVGALDGRVEHDPRAAGDEPGTQVDVFDRRVREAFAVEAARRQERVAADRAQPGPERARRAGSPVVDVVVQQVAERRDGAAGRGVVVGPEDGGQAGVVRERRADAGERVGVHLDVRVDEHEHVTTRAVRPGVARSADTQAGRTVHDHDLDRAPRSPRPGPGRRCSAEASPAGPWRARRRRCGHRGAL